MRTLLIGIDSGTQSTKAVVIDARNGDVVGSAAQEYDLIPDLPRGAKEQHPQTWRDATASAIRRALRAAKASANEVVAIGVSGQQHGTHRTVRQLPYAIAMEMLLLARRLTAARRPLH